MANDVVVYVSSVANPRKHARKIQCLESFAEGVKQSGDPVRVVWDYQYKPSRLAVILGWATTNTGGPNITLRKQIIAEQARRGAHTMCIDASCWKYLDDAGTYLRYSLGGPFYDKAEYANRNSSIDKWNEISSALNISLLPYANNNNGHILICMQRDGGFAMKTLNPLHWLEQKIEQIKKYSNRPIVIRPHPGAYEARDFVKYHTKDYARRSISVSDPNRTTLIDNLKNAHAAVFFNSSASVAAVCQGIPVFADDSSCVSWGVANKDISHIERPVAVDRQQWVQDLAAAHWSDQDARSGSIYQKFLPYLR